MEDLHAADLHHAGKGIDFHFGNRRSDCEIMEWLSPPCFTNEMNVGRFVKAGGSKAGSREVSALNQFGNRDAVFRMFEIENVILGESNRSGAAMIFFL